MKSKKLTLHQILMNMGFYEGQYEEKWIYIDGKRSIYKIRDNGEVLSTEYHGHPRKTYLSMSGGLDSDGYHIISLTHNKQKRTFKVHRLVATYFIDNKDNKSDVNHKNGNKLDNRKENLEWCTTAENSQHAGIYGLRDGSLYPELVEYLCILLSSNAYSINEMQIMTGISKPNIIKIKNGKVWKNISSKYPIDNYKSKDHIDHGNSGKRLNKDIVLKIADDLVNNVGSFNDLSIKYDEKEGMAVLITIRSLSILDISGLSK